MVRKKNRELFEILKQSRKRRQHLEEEWRERERVQRDAPVEETRPTPPIPSVSDSSVRPTVTLRQDTCILGLIGLVFLFIMTFYAGYYKGNNDARTSGRVPGVDTTDPAEENLAAGGQDRPASAAASPAAGARKQKPAAAKGSKLAPKGSWTLQVWTGKSGANDKARELVKFLRGKGFDARAKTGKTWIVVVVGNFPSRSDREAVRIQNRVRQLKYKDRLEFRDCYFVKED